MRPVYNKSVLFVAVAIGLFSVGNLVLAHSHHNGQARVGGVKNGKVHLHNTPHGHSAHAHVQNGRVRGLSVTHKGKQVGVQKFKSRRRLHALADLPKGGSFVLAETGDAVNILAGETAVDDNGSALVSAQFTAYVGFGFYNQFTNQWIIFWFPVTMVDGGDTNATDLDGTA